MFVHFDCITIKCYHKKPCTLEGKYQAIHIFGFLKLPTFLVTFSFLGSIISIHKISKDLYILEFIKNQVI